MTRWQCLEFIDWLYDNGYRDALMEFCGQYGIGPLELIAWRAQE